MKRAFQRTQTYLFYFVLTFAKAEKMAFDVGTSGKRKRSNFFDFRRIERVKQYLLIQQAQNYGFMLKGPGKRSEGLY